MRVRHGVDAQHIDPANARSKLPGEELDEGGFAGAVGPKDPEESPSDPDVKRMSHEIPVTLPNVLGDEELTVGQASL